jgi:hypothetical protein
MHKLYAELGRLQTENVKLKNNIEQLNIEGQLISTDNKVRFYTGIPSKSLFLWMVTFCSAVLPECKVMSPQSVLLCIFMKVRLNLQHQDLAYRFNISVTTISDILNKGLPKIAKKLSFLIQWPDKDNLIRNMPNVFKFSYPECVSIIDCFEVFIQRPGHLTARAQT